MSRDFPNACTERIDLGGGRTQYEIGVKSVAHPVDGTLRANDRGLTLRDGMLRATGSVEVALPATLHPARAVMSVASGGAGLSLLPVGAKPVKGKPVYDANGNWIGQRFNDAWPGADLEYVYGGHYVKPNVYLGKGHPSKFRLQLAGKSGLLVPSRDSKGAASRLTIVDSKGKPKLLTRDCYLYDPRDPMGTHIPVKMLLVSEGGQEYIDLVLPPGDLSGLVLDPTWSSQPGAAEGEDTLITLSVIGISTKNYGISTYLLVGKEFDNNNLSRTLIQFDLTSISASASVTSASLSLYCYGDGSTNARTFRVYRLKRAWVEGTRNDAEDNPPTGATWNRYDTVSNWGTVGGFGADDCEQTDIGSRDFTATETTNAFKVFSLTPITIAALDLGNGWMIKADTENADAYGFRSSDGLTASQRPYATVTTVEQASNFAGRGRVPILSRGRW